MRKTLIVMLVFALILSMSTVVAQEGFDCGTDEEVTITYIGDPAGSHPAAEEATIARFQELCPNITVDRLPGDANVQNLLAVYLTAFEAQSADFDVIRVDVIWPGLLANHLLDLSEYLPEEQLESYLPALVLNNTVDGRLVALPLRIGFGMLYYRTDLLEKYGFEAPPATWDELEMMAQTIQDGERAEGNDELWGFVWQGNAYEGLTTNALEWQVSNGGGSSSIRTASLPSTTTRPSPPLNVPPAGWEPSARRALPATPRKTLAVCGMRATPPLCATGPMPTALLWKVKP
jgi:trehalose/maltose transport system substrate-binding protein